MFGITDYGQYCLAILIFLLVPGPGNLALITSTTKGGFKGGVGSILGVMAGDQVLMWAAIAGVAAVMAAYPRAFELVQWLGAAYLAWLGLKMLLAKPGDAPVLDIKPRHYFQQSLMITLLNPKAIVFYMAFFPLFINPATHRGMVTFAAMAVTIAVITAMYCLLLCAFANAVSAKVRAHQRVARWLEKLAGLFLVAFGIRLGTQ